MTTFPVTTGPKLERLTSLNIQLEVGETEANITILPHQDRDQHPHSHLQT